MGWNAHGQCHCSPFGGGEDSLVVTWAAVHEEDIVKACALYVHIPEAGGDLREELVRSYIDSGFPVLRPVAIDNSDISLVIRVRKSCGVIIPCIAAWGAKAEVEIAMKGHVIDEAVLMGTYLKPS